MTQETVIEIFTKQSPLSAAQFEAAYRSHRECDVTKLRFTNHFKQAGASRLAPFVRSGLVWKQRKKLGMTLIYSLRTSKSH